MTFAEPTVAECLTLGVEALVRAHWREVALDQDEVPLAVNWDQYRQMEANGFLFTLTLNDGPMLCGYNIFFVMPHMHYSGTLHAMNDIVYVAPEHRGASGIRLILEAERRLKARGVIKAIYHSKEDLLLAAHARGEGAPDSLDKVEAIMDIEAEFDVKLADDLLADDMTLGGLLATLGYRKAESIYTKLLR